MPRRPLVSLVPACAVALLLLLSVASIAESTSSSVAYDSILSPLPPNVPSLGFQANQTAEFGDDIQLALSNPYLTSVTVTMSDWAKHSSYPGVGDGSGWTHPITLNIYNVDTSGANPALGSLIATATQTASIPWRPEHDASCPGDAWKAADTNCYNGLAFNLTYTLNPPVHVPQRVILGVAYNTETWGAAPLGVDGPYTSLNLGLNNVAGPTTGIDSEPDAVFWNTMTAGNYSDGGTGGTGTFRRDTAWAPYVPMFQVSAEAGCTTDCYVDAVSGNDANTGASASSAKKTVQAGVDAVSANGTVHLAAGTYNVTKVSITKPLTLSGAGAATTIIDGGASVLDAGAYGMVAISNVSGGPVDISGVTFRNAGGPSDDDTEPMLVLVDHNAADSPVTIEDSHLIGAGASDLFDVGVWEYSGDGAVNLIDNEFNSMWQGVLLERPRGGAVITGNNIHDLRTAYSDPTTYEGEGIFAMTYQADNVSALVNITGNTFSGYSGDGVVVSGGYDSGHTPATFSNLHITNNVISAIGAGPERRHVGIGLSNTRGFGPGGAGETGGGAPGAIISGNTLTGTNTTNDSIGIWLRGPSDGVQITNNVINGVNKGISSTDFVGTGNYTANSLVSNNDLSGNASGVSNASGSVLVNASGNWWGSADEAVVASKTAGSVDFTPFLDSGTDSDLPTAGFQGSFDTLHVTALGQQSSATGRIQEAVNVAAANTVLVGAGTFAEHVTVARRLTLDGAGDTTVIDPSDNGPGIVFSAGGTALNPTLVSDLKVSGVTGTGNIGSGLQITAGSHFVFQNVESSGNGGNGLAINTSSTAVDDLTLDTVEFNSNVQSGFRIPTSMTAMNGLTISDSQFNSNTFAGIEINGPPATGAVTNVSVTDSTFNSDGNKGIYAERLDNATFDGITVNASGTTGGFAAGIDLNLKKQAFTNVTIENSSITNSGTGDATNGVGITIKSRDDGTNGPTSLAGVVLTHNTITGNQYGLRLGEPTKNNVGPTGVQVTRNNISGNVSGHGVINVTQTSDDVSCNWWGSSTGPSGSGPGAGNSVSSLLTFTPWLLSSALDGPCDPISVNSAAADASGNEGSLQSTGGSFTGSVSSISADNAFGAFVDNGNGTWTWSYTPADNYGATTINVTAHGTNGSTAVDSFNSSAANVNPTATFNHPTSQLYGTAYSVSLSSPSDASSTDTTAGFTYDFDCGTGYTGTPGATNSRNCTAPSTPGNITVKGKIFDKDGGYTEYTYLLEITQPEISLLPASHSYGTQLVGSTSSSFTYTVKNVGTAPLTISDVGLAGTNPGHFGIDTNNCDAAVLSPNATCTIDVFFAPTSSGPKSARLEVDSDDPDMATAVSNLSGTGGTASTGTITIVLDARPDGAQSFAFTGGLGPFNLSDPASNTFSTPKPAGTYVIQASSVAGWSLKSLTCDASETINRSARKVTINLGSGENVTCTFTQTQRVPDASLATASGGPYTGVGIYAGSAQPSQTLNQAIAIGQTKSFYVHLTNSSLDSDSFNVFSTLTGSTKFKVSFFVGATDVTARVNAGTYNISLNAGQTVTMEIRVKAKSGTPAAATRNIDLTMKSKSSTAKDVVRAHVSRA